MYVKLIANMYPCFPTLQTWTDERLQWDPEYFNITELYIDPSRIYIPDIELYYG